MKKHREEITIVRLEINEKGELLGTDERDISLISEKGASTGVDFGTIDNHSPSEIIRGDLGE